MLPFRDTALLLFDIDGTLTDGTTWWGGDERGWVQRYSVRDGEALLRLKAKLPVLPLSRNKTAHAKRRFTGLDLDLRWLGVTNKNVALQEICSAYGTPASQICFVGDGPDDAEVFAKVGLGCAVADAHLLALKAAHVVLNQRGGERIIEEIENRMEERL